MGNTERTATMCKTGVASSTPVRCTPMCECAGKDHRRDCRACPCHLLAGLPAGPNDSLSIRRTGSSDVGGSVSYKVWNSRLHWLRRNDDLHQPISLAVSLTVFD